VSAKAAPKASQKAVAKPAKRAKPAPATDPADDLLL
jgi:hypothetical protein